MLPTSDDIKTNGSKSEDVSDSKAPDNSVNEASDRSSQSDKQSRSAQKDSSAKIKAHQEIRETSPHEKEECGGCGENPFGIGRIKWSGE